MSYFIIFAGKGGTGKSTLASLTVRYLKKKLLKPILVVDADPNYCLPELLGIHSITTLAEVRERALNNKPEGISMDEWLEIEINRIIIESEGFDMLVMGRPEGSGCYCAVNNVLKRVVQEIAEKYKYIVVDNEAGMEHLSRGIVNKIDLLFIVSTPAKSSIQSVIRINELIKDLGISPKKRIVALNQITNKKFEDEILKGNFERVLHLQFDRNIKKSSENGESIFSINENSKLIKTFYKILEEEIE